ncbi:hypothetical protein E2320_012530, partial [Naja naja]
NVVVSMPGKNCFWRRQEDGNL